MANTKQLKARLKSIKNTHKITKAMEMVAASKMKRVIDRALKTREYSQTAWEILTKITESVEKTHSLLKIRPVKRIGLILITSNKGLCGGLNTQLMKKLLANLKEPYNMMVNRVGEKRVEPSVDKKDLEVEIICVGKKGESEIVKNGQNLVASFNNFNESTSISGLRPVIKMAVDGYKKKKYDKVILAYTDFISSIVNKPRLRQVLPISQKDIERQIEEIGGGIAPKEKMDQKREEVKEKFYTFEPSREEILDRILPKVVESQIFQAFLEHQASEFSARMMTMKNASDTAKEMIDNFSFQYNQARQAAITSELAEINAGMAVLGN
jgi:F-type H+-transporting ATPase subunit gamma